MKKWEWNHRYVLLIFFALFFCFCVYTWFSTVQDRLQIDTPVDFNDGWDSEADEEQRVLRLKREITSDMEGKTISFYLTDAFLDAYIGDTLIYHFGQESRFCKSPGSLQQFIVIPDKTAGETLLLQIQAVYAGKFVTDYHFRFGSSGALLLELIIDELPDTAANVIIFILGVIMCILYVLERRNGSKLHKNLYLGLFSIFFVIWSNSALFVNQLMVPYGILQYYLYYFTLYLLPAFLICYLETIADGINCKIEFAVHMTLVTVLALLQLLHIADFTESIGFFLVIMAGEIVSIIIKVARQKPLQKNHLHQIGFEILLIFMLLNSVQYYFFSSGKAPLTLVKIGICVYLVIAIYSGMEQLLRSISELREARALKKIAYTDNLTGLGNRYAFDRDIKEIEFSRLGIVSMDLNNLKYYNDNFGHTSGDMLIQEASKLIKEVYGQVYRVGGDEFLALSIDMIPEKHIRLREILLEKAEKYNEDSNNPFILEIACGSSHYHEGDASYEDILKRADAKMYRHKKLLKADSRLKDAVKAR